MSDRFRALDDYKDSCQVGVLIESVSVCNWSTLCILSQLGQRPEREWQRGVRVRMLNHRGEKDSLHVRPQRELLTSCWSVGATDKKSYTRTMEPSNVDGSLRTEYLLLSLNSASYEINS